MTQSKWHMHFTVTPCSLTSIYKHHEKSWDNPHWRVSPSTVLWITSPLCSCTSLRAWWLLSKDLSVSLSFRFWSAFSAPSVNMLRLSDTLVNGWTLKDEGSTSHYFSFPISQDSAEHIQTSGCWGTHQKRQNVGSVTQTHWSYQNLGSDPVRTSSYGPLKSQSSWEQKRTSRTPVFWSLNQWHIMALETELKQQ